MPELNEASFEQVISACQENSAGIAESLGQCFDQKYRVEVGDSFPWNANDAPASMDGPGLLVAFEIEGQGLICLVPSSLPLPEWYTTPGESEAARLQTLAMEWSLNLLPADFEAERFETIAVENLKNAVIEASPAEWAGVIELLVSDPANESSGSEGTAAEEAAETDTSTEEATSEDSDSSSEADATAEEAEANETSADDSAETGTETTGGQSAVKLFVIGAVQQPPFAADDAASAPESLESGESAVPDFPLKAPVEQQNPISESARRLLNLPVVATVRLAEKKIEMAQLLSLTPGALITFNKSCEDLLELYINNHHYCRGEAVKVGEKFGLKINVVGVVEERVEHVL